MDDELKDSWGEAAAGFSSLGRAMRDRYRVDPSDPSPETAATSGTTGTTSGAGDVLRQALAGLIAAGREVDQRAIEVLRDPTVNEQAKQAVSSLKEALATTVQTIGGELAGRFGRSPGDADADAPDEARHDD
jgi:hypothetical protein